MASPNLPKVTTLDKLKPEQVTAVAAEIAASAKSHDEEFSRIAGCLDDHFADILYHVGVVIEGSGRLEDEIETALVFGIQIGWKLREVICLEDLVGVS